VANLLVLIELVGERPHPGSLEALGQARRLATSLGATVYAVAPCAATPGYGDDDLIAVLSRHGADKVLLATAESYGGPPRWGTLGSLLLTVCHLLPPTLLLCATTDGARDFAPRVAARLGAALLADAWIDLQGDGLSLFDGSGDTACRLDGELEYPVVAMIPPGRYLPARGDEEAEVEMLEPRASDAPDFEEAGWEADRPLAVVLGSGPAAEQLAAALDGVTAGGNGSARLAVAIAAPAVAPAPTIEQALASAHAEAKVALGPGAVFCSTARYAVEGDPERLADELASAVATLATGERA
jgi:hypothetical protein